MFNQINTFVISVPNQNERRGCTEKKLNSMGIEFSFFDAVWGKDVISDNRNDYRKLLDSSAFEKLNPGEIGCALSHYLVYKKILDEKIPFSLILEDDIQLHEDFPELSREIYECAERLSWDICFLSHFRNVRPSFWRTIKLSSKFKIAPPVDPPYGTQAYIISYNWAKKLLEEGSPVRMPSDWLTSKSRDLGGKVYGIFPPIARHSDDELPSLIGVTINSNDQNKGKVKRKRLKEIRLVYYIISFIKRLIFPYHKR